MKLAIIFNRYHTSMICKRAPVHLQCYATSTGTSNSRQANKHQYINAKAIKSRIPVFTRSKFIFRPITIFQDDLSQPSILLFQVQTKKLLDLFFLPSCLSVEFNLNLNFFLNQRDNILLVTFLNQSSTHRLVYLLHIRVRVTVLGLRSVREQNLAQHRQAEV